MAHDGADQRDFWGIQTTDGYGSLRPVIPALGGRGHRLEASLVCTAVTSQDYILRICLKKRKKKVTGFSAILNHSVLRTDIVPKA